MTVFQGPQLTGERGNQTTHVTWTDEIMVMITPQGDEVVVQLLETEDERRIRITTSIVVDVTGLVLTAKFGVV